MEDSYPPAGGRGFKSRSRYKKTLSDFLGGFFSTFRTMFSTYVLYSEKFNKIYIGYTSDLENRIIAHNEKATKGYTLRYRPWKIVHTEIFEFTSEALRREKELKTARGRKFIWDEIISKIK